MKSDSTTQINYIEFPATDLTAIKAFYSTVFGWTFTDYGPSYVAFNDGTLDGGFTTDAKIASGAGPLVVLYSQNIEHSLENVKNANGVITREIFDFPGGRRFHFKDPSGNELAVWTQ